MTGAFEETLRTYADEARAKYAVQVDAQDEDALKSLVGDLLRDVGAGWDIETEWRSEARAEGDIGRPDLGITANGLLCGHIELKAPGRGARPERFRGRDREQWNRFQALPNLIYTDGSEWSLYRSGERTARIRISADVTDDGATGLDAASLGKIEGLLRDFLMHEPVTPSTARGLAEFLAPLARLLRDEVGEALAEEGSGVRQIAGEWRGVLFGDAEDDQFADAYAQTVTYALLLAQFEGAENLRQAVAVDELRQNEHDLLAAALDLLERARHELEMPIDLLERAIEAVDAQALLAGGGGPGANDPWLYFYEHFLAAYDAKLRKSRGVYFTPVEVVRAQVRFAAELLRERFGKRTGFGDSGVEVLDPACGTGTYPLAVLEHAAESVRDELGAGATRERLRDLAGRLHAFEILVGPYAVAQLRLTQQLRELGVDDQNPLVYLTDTLESPNLQSQMGGVLYEDLTQERERARQVKREKRIFVCLGNPPYDREQREADEGEGRRKGGWVRHGDPDAAVQAPLEAFLAPVRRAGDGRYLTNLYNDYVYFWSWTLWKVFDSTAGPGIVTFITASSYLRGPGFAGMRRKMREVFDDLWIIDLEGDSLGARKTENVFDIQIPVAIAIGVRDGEPDPGHPASVHRVRLRGTSAEKLGVLDAAESLTDFDWRECVAGWGAPFMTTGVGEYFDWPAVTDVFPWQHSGVKASRTWPIGVTREVLNARWQVLLELPPEARGHAFKETTERRVDRQYPSLLGEGSEKAIGSLAPGTPAPAAASYAFRTLDRQWIVADSRIGDRMRPELWRAHGPKQLHMTGLLTELSGDGAAVFATAAIPDLHHFRGSFGGKHVVPLYRDAESAEPNITGGLLAQIEGEYGVAIVAERLFAYAYAVLAQPSYVERFWDELEQPPPRLPITKDANLFVRVADLGERLLHLHTYGERFRSGERGDIPRGQTRNIKDVGEALPEGHSYDPGARVLHVGKGEFAPVSPEVYEYSVSGFHVVKSWLDRRKLERSGRKSSPLDDIRPDRWEFSGELLELLWVLEETIRLEPEGAALLDEVCNSDLFTAAELPTPSEEQRLPPGQAQQAAMKL